VSGSALLSPAEKHQNQEVKEHLIDPDLSSYSELNVSAEIRCTYRHEQNVVFVSVRWKQNPVDLMDDPVYADVVAVCHVCLVDEDCSLKK